MIVKKWNKNGSYYWMKVNFKNKTVYTDIIQITLEKPWFLPRYEDDFAGIKGLRLYGWLFFYFGRTYQGFIYPAEDSDTGKTLIDKTGKHWNVLPREKIVDFESNLKLMKRGTRKGMELVFTLHYNVLKK